MLALLFLFLFLFLFFIFIIENGSLVRGATVVFCFGRGASESLG